jgi:translocation and assembly module TamA
MLGRRAQQGSCSGIRLLSATLLAFLFSLLAVCPVLAAPVTVTVRGLEGQMLRNVQAALAVPPGLVREGKVDQHWLARFRRQIPENVRQALEPFGYFQPEIDTRLEPGEGNAFQLVVQVDAGAPVLVGKRQVGLTGAGNDEADLQELISEFPLREGDVLRQDLYEEAKGAIKARAIDLGYLNAEFSIHEIRVNREERNADIDLVLDTGARFLFGEVTIHGGEIYPRRFLRRYLAFAPGEVFSFAKLGQTQLNFLDSDRFREVIVTPDEAAAQDEQVPVTIQLEASRPKRLRPGLGYATDTGARLSLRYEDVNSFQLGHEFETDLLIAERKQSVGAGYVIPSRKSIESQTAFRLSYDDEDVDTYERRTLSAEVERRRSFGRNRLGSVYLRLLQEDYTVGEESSSTFLTLPGARYSRRTYGNTARPEKGYFYSSEIRGTHQILGSEVGLLQLLASANQLFSLPARFSLFLRAQGGMTLQNEPLQEVPPSLRFFAGGDKSVRGYAFESLGPTDENGDVTGGKNLLVGSIEVERAIKKNWGVALFYDVGNAFNDFNRLDLRQGAGLGVRWYTPVGPVKVDLARQMGQSDPAFRLHVSIGFGW